MRSWQRAGYATARPNNTAPPQPRPYRPSDPSERIARRPYEAIESPKPRKRTLTQRLFSLRSEPEPYSKEPQDIVRGLEASRRVVKEGILDPRYRSAGRKVTAIICALPLALYLTYELGQRRFMGKEQKLRPVPKADVSIEG